MLTLIVIGEAMLYNKHKALVKIRASSKNYTSNKKRNGVKQII